MALPLRCNTESYFIAISAAFFISKPNSRIIDEVSTKLYHTQDVQGTQSMVPHQGLPWPYHFRYNAEMYFIVIVVNFFIFSPNFSLKNKILTL